MAKVVPIIVTMLLLNVAMFMFTFSGTTADECGANCQLSNNTDGNSVVNYFADPTQQSQSSLWVTIFGVAGILAILVSGGIVAGAVYVTKDLNVAYISIASILIVGVMATWIRLWGFVNKSGFILGGDSGGIVVMICVGTLMSVHLFQLIDWGRGVS